MLEIFEKISHLFWRYWVNVKTSRIIFSNFVAFSQSPLLTLLNFAWWFLFRHQVGPGYYERWTKWNSRTEEESKKAAILSELERLLLSDDEHRHSDPKLIIQSWNSAILYYKNWKLILKLFFEKQCSSKKLLVPNILSFP